jgi:hypothetical protein
MYQFLLSTIKLYIKTGISKGSEIMRDTTTTTKRQHMHPYKVQHDGRRQND